MLEPILLKYLPFSQTVTNIYRYLREDRNEVRFSNKLASLNMQLDEILQKPKKETLYDALNNVNYIMRLIEQLHGSGYVIAEMYEATKISGQELTSFLQEMILFKPETQPSFPVSLTDERSFSELYTEAKGLALNNMELSVSMIQRCLRVGYARAGRLFDELKKDGFIELEKNLTNKGKSLLFQRRNQH